MFKRTIFSSVVVLVLIILVLAACGGGGGAPAPSTQGDAKAGAETWVAAGTPCRSCHGMNAEGQSGPKLAGTGLSLDQVKNTVRNGKGTRMPKFSADQVSDADIANIYAWLKTLK